MKKWLLIFIFLLSALSYPLQSIKAGTTDTLEWKERAELPDARVGAVSQVYDGKIYVIGGAGSGKPFSNTTYVYDPNSDKWSEKANMKTGRMGAASAIVGDRIYVMGGKTEQGYVNSVEVYNIKMDTWEDSEDIPFERKVSAYNLYAGVIEGKIYVAGYDSALKASGYNNTYSYDIKTKEWTKKKKFDFVATSGNAVVLKNKLYILTGSEVLGTKVFEYDPQMDQWKGINGGAIAPYHSAVGYEDFIIRTGGVSRVTLYDLDNQKSSTVPTTSAPNRMGHVSALVNDTLYVIGGVEASSSSPTTARKDFKSNLSLSLSSLKNNDAETPGNKDREPTTPPKDDPADEEGDALLIITMVNGLQKEYDLSMKEVNAFLSWYKKRDVGEGPGFYEIDEHDNNKGPFESKKDYVVFKNILMFEVNKYKK